MATFDFVVRLKNGSAANLAGEAPRREGDIVFCRQKPHSGFGKRVVPPTYGILTVTDITKAQAEAMCQYNYTEYHPDDALLPVDEKRVLFHVRIGNYINFKTFPPALLAQLKGGKLTMDYATFVLYNKDRVVEEQSKL